PPSTGVVAVQTCGSAFDTAVAVYTGNCATLTPVPDGCNVIGCNTQSVVNFNGTASVPYLIFAAGAFPGQSGTLQIVAQRITPPSNDQCSGAISLNSGPTITMNTASAT